MKMNKTYINNYQIFGFQSKNDFLEIINGQNKILIALNAEKVLKNDEKLKQIVNENIGFPDGIGTVMALRRKNVKAIKIPGAEFWLDIIRHFENKKSFYFVGSTQEVIEKTVDKLRSEFKQIDIAGYRNGFLKDNDKQKLIDDLKDKKPDVVFVAQGSPRQEFLMNELFSEYPALYMGLGGSFDVYCGLKKRAPHIFQTWGLEWLYRLLKEPTRWRRQIILIKFFSQLATNKL